MGCFQTTGTPKPPTSNHWLKPMEVQGCSCTRCLASQPLGHCRGLAWQPTFASWWWSVDTCRCIETVWKNMWVHWKNGGLKSEFQILDFWGGGPSFFLRMLSAWIFDAEMIPGGLAKYFFGNPVFSRYNHNWQSGFIWQLEMIDPKKVFNFRFYSISSECWVWKLISISRGKPSSP